MTPALRELLYTILAVLSRANFKKLCKNQVMRITSEHFADSKGVI